MRLFCVVMTALPAFLLGTAFGGEEDQISFSECPAPVRKTIQAEAKDAKIETVTKETDENNEVVYWAKFDLNSKLYRVGSLEDGTLTEVILAVDEGDIPLEHCPPAVQATFRNEAFGEKIGEIAKDMKFGHMIYQTVVVHKEKPYEIVVADDGTLVEKTLVIDDEEIKLSECPAVVRAALHEHAKGGEISDVTRFTGIGQHTFEAEVKLKDRVYLIEVTDTGLLISKSLEALRD